MARRAKPGPAKPKRRKSAPRNPGRPRGGPATALARPTPERGPRAIASDVAATRELFWQNVMREILTNLSMVSGRNSAPAHAPAPPDAAAIEASGQGAALAPGAEVETSEEMELFDGRLAVITRQGQRVPIAEVFPLFACGIATPGERTLSMEVECTVFQIRTPGGEVFTLPLEEMRTFHSLTPELMQKLERAARRESKRRGEPPDEEQIPFGFAAFTSLSRGGPSIVPEAPIDPSE